MDVMGVMDKRLEQIFYAVSVLVVAFVVGRILRFLLGRFLKASARKLKVDPTRYNFFKNALDFIIFLGAIIIIFRSIPSLHDFSTTLMTGAGVLAAIIGFASQSAFSNIVSGIFLVIFRPFSVGDRVKVGQLHTGDVEDITLRHTVIRDFENRRIIIPNNVISNETIINSTITDEKIIVYLEVVVAFEANTSRVIQIIQEEALAHRYCIDNRTPEEIRRGETPVMVRVLSFLETGLQLRGYVWTNNPTDAFDLKCEVLQSLKDRFAKENIPLPYPHRVILTRNQP